MKKLLAVIMLFLTVALATACTAEELEPEPEPPTHPDVTSVFTERSEGMFHFTVTISSEYDSEERFADAFRVRSTDGDEYAVRELGRHHADEQPFTRELGEVEIPEEVTVVVIEGRDSDNGWGGETIEVDLSEISTGSGGSASLQLEASDTFDYQAYSKPTGGVAVGSFTSVNVTS